jgi:hypothetical protein
LISEYSKFKKSSFKEFRKGLPEWTTLCEWVLASVVLGHVVWFGMHSSAGIPALRNGQYVIESRGQVLRMISESEYFSLRTALVRMFSSLIIYFYFMPTIYWWSKTKRASGRTTEDPSE